VTAISGASQVETIGPIASANGQKRFGVEGILRLNRLDYGLRSSRAPANGGWLVGDDVKI
jgi:hypothetical protein